MPINTEADSWRGKATDIAYKDPFSETTNRLRKKVFLFSSLILINHFFPIDLAKSHFLGIHFSEGHVPSLSGFVGFVLLYFFIVFGVYSYQEIKSWVAQANELHFVSYRRNLHDIFAHNSSIDEQIKNTATQLKNHSDAMDKLVTDDRGGLTSRMQKFEYNLSQMKLHMGSYSTLCRKLEGSNNKYRDEVLKAEEVLNKAESDYRKAMTSQWVKVAILEIFLPIFTAIISFFLSADGIVQVLNIILH